MTEFIPIPNPYIVGNPIKSRNMFFGRRDDFDYIKRKLQSGVKSYIIVFSGERRSGKTSILFQVLNGELGESFLPIMIDMQTMAGLQNENEFFEKIAREILRGIDENAVNVKQYNFFEDNVSPYKVLGRLLDDIHTKYPEKNILFLIDEYELIESKISEGSLSKNFVPFLAGVLESERKISFLFTGSKKLDERKSPYWNILFAKSLYRNVSFLSKNDSIRLITEPIKDHVTYDEEVINKIYRLTAGQPFYIQVCCQNIVDHLNEKQKNSVAINDLDEIIDEILENPLPQMIYFWNSLSNEKKLILSLLPEILENPDSFIQAPDMHKFSRKREFGINLTLKTISTTLETLYHQQLLKKTAEGYCFYMDLFRLWIKQDHSFWQVMKEISADLTGINVEDSITITQAAQDEKSAFFEKEKKRSRKFLIPIVGVGFILLAGAGYWFFSQSPSQNQGQEGLLPAASEDLANQEGTPDTGRSNLPKENLASSENQRAKPNESAKTGQGTIAEKEIDATSKADAINVRKSMQGKKNEARQVGAAKTIEFQRGQSRENQAERSLASGQYDTALNLFKQAGKDYSEARLASLRNVRNEVAGLLQEVNDARDNAQKNNADELASKTYSDAVTKENQGKNLYDQQRYGEAKSALQEANRLYASSTSEANHSSRQLDSEIRIVQNSLQQLKSQAASAQYLEEYQKASNAEKQANSYLQNRNEIQAFENFQIAERLYRQAHTIHNDRVNQINQVIRNYENALESKDIQQLESLYYNFGSEMQERWNKLFKSVDQVEAQMAVLNTNFQQEKALTMVDVHLKYSGFASSDTRIKWEIEFIPVNNKLLIKNINESN